MKDKMANIYPTNKEIIVAIPEIAMMPVMYQPSAAVSDPFTLSFTTFLLLVICTIKNKISGATNPFKTAE